ncbi:hypothetical protein P170DRAFT_508218 [Aspergillus steynii IBT 23096]|uniref:Zn(2)-C6 fungal-type domain-containing protein n=1 Tax=Aspergillus steynii IBT 23096 TaxID=1392250 RepID=A0A2I2GAL5_9EURO|nr:uncharacterized protein P170DRAFT_508218 [Aspergillus steynii IBT 23096]PLB49926.1 hypothetical protein P170DRAFT_508218 [Aspergillus steynii IBT 23096]
MTSWYSLNLVKTPHWSVPTPFSLLKILVCSTSANSPGSCLAGIHFNDWTLATLDGTWAQLASRFAYMHTSAAMRPRQSGRRLRVTTGCITCRSRRVKCDERRPVCRNCAKKGRPCNYRDKPRETSTDQGHGPVDQGHVEPLAQAASSIGSDNTQVVTDTASSPSNIRPRVSGIPPEALTNQNPAQLTGEQNEPSYTHTARSERATAHNEIHSLEPSPAPNLCAILHTKFPGRSHPSSQANSSTNTPTTHQHLEVPIDEHPTQRPFYVTDPIQLSPTEVIVFRNYVERVSKWIDSFSHDQPFYNKVPSLALHCPMLLHACLAASAKQMTRAPQYTGSLTLATSPVFYYQQALREMSHFLIEPGYSGSDELLASSIILSTYEILDVAGDSFGSHLKGVASLIRSHRITGDEDGIRGATYWTWYRHEVWVAFQSGRRMFLDERYWRPGDMEGGFEGISMRDVANRVLFIFGQAVSFYVARYRAPGSEADVDGDTMTREEWDARQRNRARELQDALADWERRLPASMRICLRQDQGQTGTGADAGHKINQFPALWFAYPESAVSHQLHHASKILLLLRTPTLRNDDDPFLTRRELESSRREIFMVANSQINQAWGLISTQCLYVAGLVTDGILERECTLELIETCQRTTGRQTVCIADQLRGFWE